MVASVVSICNSALTKLGAERISSLTEENKRAKLCNDNYEKIKEEVLRERAWNCATKRVELGKLATTPSFGFAYEFGVPGDCVHVLKVFPDRPFALEDGKILSDSGQVKIQYTCNVDEYKMDATLKAAISTRLAMELSYSLNQSVSLKQDLQNQYKQHLEFGGHNSSTEKTPESNTNDVWLDARIAGIGIYE